MAQTVISDYLLLHKKYSGKYGEKTIIFMMIGGFYELYSLEEEGPDLSKISEITNLVKTRKAKATTKPSVKNPYMMGFNIAALEKFVRIMIDNGYYVIRIDQTTPPPRPKRDVVAIYSPGTYLDAVKIETNNIVSIYIEDERNISTGEYLSCIGLSAVDLTTGQCIVYEVYSQPADKKYALDEAYRFILGHNPKEILIIKGDKCKLDKEYLIECLELESYSNIHFFDKVHKAYTKISYQNEFLEKIYPKTFVSPIEDIDMAKIGYARISFIALLDFSYQHNEDLIKDLSKPKIFENSDHLIVGNNAIYQLNILEGPQDTGNSKIKSLYDVVNNASTPMGKRFLKSTLTQPICNIEELKLRYNSTDEILNLGIYKKLEKHLKSIPDIERLIRKLFIMCIQPYELANLMESFTEVKQIYKLINTSKIVSTYAPSIKIMDSLSLLIEDVESKFNLDEMKMNNLNNITGSFFNEGIYPKIDSLHRKVVTMGENMEEICCALSKYIEGKTDMIKLKRNNRDGYYLSLTKKRADTLKKSLQKYAEIPINENLTIPLSSLEFKELASGTTKIFIDDLGTSSDQTVILKEKLVRLVKKEYKNVLSDYGEKYKSVFQIIPNFISMIDFLKSNAKTASIYNYCKPEIQLCNKSFFKASKLRHAIAERIITNVEYIPHDVNLGCEGMDGMLLFGLNSAGKSTLQKAIGISVIMSQCGMYVPAENFVYSPYKNMFARITGNDNIFKGLSQFALEMTELDSILKRNTPNTLVIGDEVCKGTEHKSGTAIVAATIVMLAEKNCNFIFATHLHDVANLKAVKALPNVKTFHLSVEHDKERDVLVFDRLLKPGSGRDDYGLTVAKFIIKNPKFIKLAQQIKKSITGKLNGVLNSKRSGYNKECYVHECQICGLQNKEEKNMGYLDTHHINHQSKCNEGGFIIGKSHLKKDDNHNLVVLCKLCHYKAHHDLLIIRGYKDTTKGRILDYEFVKTEIIFN